MPADPQLSLTVSVHVEILSSGIPAVPADVDQIRRALLAHGANGASSPGLAAPRPGRRSGGDRVPDVIATVTGSASALSQMIDGLKKCLAALGTPRRSAELTINGNSIKITGLSRENEDRLIAAFVHQACGKS